MLLATNVEIPISFGVISFISKEIPASVNFLIKNLIGLNSRTISEMSTSEKILESSTKLSSSS